jgi:hypothetical protein
MLLAKPEVVSPAVHNFAWLRDGQNHDLDAGKVVAHNAQWLDPWCQP